MKGRVLLADNNQDFLDTCAEFLELAGYKIWLASSPAEAQRALIEEWVHLAVLDLRLDDDGDAKDKSGLILAKSTAPAVPKIILTDYPTYQDVRKALLPVVEGSHYIINYLDKGDGLKALLSAVEEAFAQHIRINWDLVIQTSEGAPVTFPHLVNLIEADLKGEQLLSRAEELEDLFRRLFYEKSQIRIDCLLWQREGRVAVLVYAFAEGKPPESLIVVCGQNAPIVEESRRYKDYAPKAPGPTATVLVRTSETSHLAANSYSLAGTNLDNVHALVELYRSGPDKSFSASVKSLYEKTLAEWYQDKRILEENETLDELYRNRLGLTEDRVSRAEFEQRLLALIRQTPILGLKIEYASGLLTIRFNGQSFSYPDPLPILYQRFNVGQPVVLTNSPGMLSGENVLTDASEKVWVTDFAGAGLAPLLWNFVTLEAAIRFDWLDAGKLQWVHEMEQYLIAGEFARLHPGDVEAPLRKAMKAIQTIRLLASRIVGKDSLPYHLGILFQAASRLADFNSAFRLTQNELARLAHVLMSAAMICNLIRQSQRGIMTEPKQTGIRIDKTNRIVWVDDVRVTLRGHSYDLLCVLYDHPNQLRARRELVEQVFNEPYDETDESQISRLNTAIYRLRDKIEEDPDAPRFLLTEPGGGYRLVPHPQ